LISILLFYVSALYVIAGSTDPAAMLFDATEAFEDGDAKVTC
jgi:hypothetical protein